MNPPESIRRTFFHTQHDSVISATRLTKTDLQALSAHFDAKLGNLEARFDTKLANMDTKLDTLSLRLTVRLGAMLAVAVGILATVIKLVP